MNNGTDYIQVSDNNGWANWTFVTGAAHIKVKYYGKWVNGTFSVTMDADKTIDVKCKLYDVTVAVKEGLQSAYLVGVNVTVFNASSTYGNRIKSGITSGNGQVYLTNLPNDTLTFTQYGGSSFTLVIGNTTELISSEDQSITLTADENYLGVTDLRSIPIAVIGSIFASEMSFKRRSIMKRIKRKQNKLERGEKKDDVKR